MRPAWIACVSVLAALELQAQPARVVSACDDTNEWPPYTYRVKADAAGGEAQIDGFAVAVLRQVAERAGWQLRLQLLPWKRCVEAVRSGEMHLALNAILTPERERDYWPSSVLYETRLLGLWSRERRPNGLGELNNAALARLRAAGVRGYSYSQLTPERAAKLDRTPNYDSLMQMLHLGRVDVGLINEGVLQGMVQQGHPAFAQAGRYGVAPLTDHQPSHFHVLFTRTGPEGRALQQRFDAEWARMQKNGDAERLRQRYLRMVP